MTTSIDPVVRATGEKFIVIRVGSEERPRWLTDGDTFSPKFGEARRFPSADRIKEYWHRFSGMRDFTAPTLLALGDGDAGRAIDMISKAVPEQYETLYRRT